MGGLNRLFYATLAAITQWRVARLSKLLNKLQIRAINFNSKSRKK